MIWSSSTKARREEAFASLGLEKGRYLIAFSGGPDSVFLLLSLRDCYPHDFSLRFALAYVNYHDSPYVGKEEEIVHSYAETYRLKLYQKDSFFQESTAHNFEDWARKVRYDFFEETVNSLKMNGVIVAHQQNDNLETYLLQKRRKSLVQHYGLPSETRRGSLMIYRPLLSIGKNEILHSLDSTDIPYYDDITNRHTTRYIAFRKQDFSLQEKAELEASIQKENARIVGIYQKLSKLPTLLDFQTYETLSAEEKKRLLYQRIGSFNGIYHLPSLVRNSLYFLKKKANGALVLSADLALYKTRKGFFFSAMMTTLHYTIKVTAPGSYDTPFFTLTFSDPKAFNMPAYPFLLRNARAGDQIATDLPEKDVYRFLKKQQVPRFLFPVYPVLCDREGKIKGVPFYKDFLAGTLSMKSSLRPIL